MLPIALRRQVEGYSFIKGSQGRLEMRKTYLRKDLKEVREEPGR